MVNGKVIITLLSVRGEDGKPEPERDTRKRRGESGRQHRREEGAAPGPRSKGGERFYSDCVGSRSPAIMAMRLTIKVVASVQAAASRNEAVLRCCKCAARS